MGVLEKLLYYPKIVFESMNFAYLFFAFVGIAVIFRNSKESIAKSPAIFLLVALVSASIFNLTSGPPSAAPGRYSLLYVMFLSPYFAFGLCQIPRLTNHFSPKLARLGKFGTLCILMGVLSVHLSAALNFPRGILKESIQAGEFLATQVRREGTSCSSKILIERVYWEYLGVLASSNLSPCFQVDREGSARNRNEPSVLSDAASLKSLLQRGEIEYALIWNDRQNGILNEFEMSRRGLQQNFGPWSFYKF